MKKTIIFSLIAMIGIYQSCKSPETIMNEGNYDLAISKSLKKLRKNKTKEKHIRVLEESFQKANQRDLDRINYANKEGTPEGKELIADTYHRIKARQNRIRPILPLYIESEARDARFSFINVDDELIHAKEQASEALYNRAIELLDKKERIPAREAFNRLMKIKTAYFATYKDIDQQLARAQNLGTNKVLFFMANTTGVPLPPRFEQELMKISLSHLNRPWLEYHTSKNDNYFYDYTIRLNFTVIDVSPEIRDSEPKLYKKEVSDGFEYVLDKNGNVMKDTSGNDVKLPKYKTITCLLKETYQRKVAHLEGKIDYTDNRTKQLVGSFPVATDAIFEHRYSSLSEGDISILEPKDKALLNREFIPYPNDFDLLLQAGETLKPLVSNILNERKGIVKY